MTESCIDAIERGADLRQVVGCRELAVAINTPKSVRIVPDPNEGRGAQGIKRVEHEANELLIRITCDIVALASQPGIKSSATDAQALSDRIMVTSKRNRSGQRTDRSQTVRSGAASAPLPSITISPMSPLQSPGNAILPWAAGSKILSHIRVELRL